MYNFFNLEFPTAMECLSSGKLSIDPRNIALSETFIYETRQLTYYILKIKELGYENLAMVETVIDTLSSVNFGFEYQKKDIENLLANLYAKRNEVAEFYETLCRQKNLDCQLLHSAQPSNDDISLIKAIMRGEKQSIKKNTQISSCKKNLYQIMIMMAKSASSLIMKLNDYNIDCINERYQVLEFINALNFLNFREEKIAKKIIKFAQINYELNLLLNEKYKEKYSTPNLCSVSFNRNKGKAILVSGDNLNELDLLLQATEGTGINVYTHDLMLLAFQYPYFRRFPHLIAQYQHKERDFQLDFSEFPGPILLTKDYTNKINPIYRGNIFSTDFISGVGITKIKNYDFAPLIKSANNLDGFSQSEKRTSIKIGYDINDIFNKIDTILKMFNNNKYNDIYIVGLLNYSNYSGEFFEKLYQKIGSENFIISLAYDKKAENILHIKSFFDFSLVYKIIQRIKEKLNTNKNTIKIVLTQCTNATLTNLFIMKQLGINDIYISCCNINTLNPSIMDCLTKQFSVKQLQENQNFEL